MKRWNFCIIFWHSQAASLHLNEYPIVLKIAIKLTENGGGWDGDDDNS